MLEESLLELIFATLSLEAVTGLVGAVTTILLSVAHPHYRVASEGQTHCSVTMMAVQTNFITIALIDDK